MKPAYLFGAAALTVLLIGGYGGYRFGMQQGMHMAAPATSTSAATQPSSPSATRKPLYWHDPMVPGQRFDKPGKSPFMDMQLVPVYATDNADGGEATEGQVSISAQTQQNLGMRTAAVIRGTLGQAITAVGSVAYNERDVELVQARANGFVEHLYVRAPLDAVRQGQALAELYVPEWIAAQEEFLTARRIAAGPNDGIIDGARQRMRLVGMNDAQIGAVATSGRVQPRVTISAPRSGVIAELTVRDGMTVSAGAPMFRINGIASVWVNAELPENVLTQIRIGTPVEARTPALPGTVLQGKVSALLGEVNPTTRTVKARIELPNPSGQLVPGMFARLQFNSAGGAPVLLIPSEAVIQTGMRSVVMVAQDQGKFAPVEVETGVEANGQTEIRKGLAAGQKVVVSGQFLIDSEASLKGAITRMSAAPAPTGDAVSVPVPSTTAAPSSAASATPVASPASTPTPTPAQTQSPTQTLHHGIGKVESINKDEITISHGPIASLKWGAMTMGFQLPPAGLPAKIVVGDTVTFDIRALQDGQFGIAQIAPTTPTAPVAAAQMAPTMSMPPASPSAAKPAKPAGGKL